MSPVVYGQLAGAVSTAPVASKFPQVAAAAVVVMVTLPGACATAPGTLHSVSLCAYSPCRDTTVHCGPRLPDLICWHDASVHDSVFPQRLCANAASAIASAAHKKLARFTRHALARSARSRSSTI